MWGGPCGRLGAGTPGQAVCLCDDSRPMITACAYLGSVNRRGREEVRRKTVAGKEGARGEPPLHVPPTPRLALWHPALPLPLPAPQPASKRTAEADATWVGPPTLHQGRLLLPWLPGPGEGNQRSRAIKAETGAGLEAWRYMDVNKDGEGAVRALLRAQPLL